MHDFLKVKNLFIDTDAVAGDERFDELLASSSFRVERIVSHGHHTPGGYWYDQDHAEWVLILQGQATLAFEKEPENMIMKSGDYILIPPHARHRVLSTAPDRETIWLAIHYGENI